MADFPIAEDEFWVWVERTGSLAPQIRICPLQAAVLSLKHRAIGIAFVTWGDEEAHEELLPDWAAAVRERADQLRGRADRWQFDLNRLRRSE